MQVTHITLRSLAFDLDMQITHITPRSLAFDLDDAQTGPKSLKGWCRKALRHDVSVKHTEIA